MGVSLLLVEKSALLNLSVAAFESWADIMAAEYKTSHPSPSGHGLPSRGKSRLNLNVHGARGLFAAFVFAFHVVNSGLATYAICKIPAVNSVLKSMEYGVELFFIISGFVITESLKSHVSPGAFLRNRAVRIFPVLWATIAVLVVLEPLFHKNLANIHAVASLWILPANLLALPGVLPLPLIHPAAWSLSYEFCFYLVCTLALCLIGFVGQTRAMIVTALLSCALVIFYPRAIFFLVGVLVARLPRVPRALGWLVKMPGLWLIAFLVSWESIQNISPEHIQFYTLINWAGDLRLPLAAGAIVAAGLCFIGLVQGQGLISRFLRLAPLQWLGTVSYSFYLWHPIVMASVKHVMLSTGIVEAAGPSAQILLFTLALPPTLFVAVLSQRILEVKTRIWIGSIANNRRRQDLPAHSVRALPFMHEQ